MCHLQNMDSEACLVIENDHGLMAGTASLINTITNSLSSDILILLQKHDFHGFFICFNILFVLLLSNRITCEAANQDAKTELASTTNPELTFVSTPFTNQESTFDSTIDPVPTYILAAATDLEPTLNPTPTTNVESTSDPKLAIGLQPTSDLAPVTTPQTTPKPPSIPNAEPILFNTTH